jgi:hypothetical protein
MSKVIWKLLDFWRVEKQIAEECRWVDETLGLEEQGELAPVYPLAPAGR